MPAYTMSGFVFKGGHPHFMGIITPAIYKTQAFPKTTPGMGQFRIRHLPSNTFLLFF